MNSDFRGENRATSRRNYGTANHPHLATPQTNALQNMFASIVNFLKQTPPKYAHEIISFVYLWFTSISNSKTLTSKVTAIKSKVKYVHVYAAAILLYITLK